MSEWKLTQTYKSPQGRIRWDKAGSGAPLVLLHGTPNWSYIWRSVVPHLSKNFTVYFFDWPGYGASNRFEGQNISWDEQPRRLVELCRHWELERPAFVAFDFAPVLLLRVHFMERLPVGPIIFADAAVLPPFVTDFSRLVRENIGVFRQLPCHIAEGMIAAHIKTATHRPMTAETLEQYLKPWRGEEGVEAYWRAVESYDENLASPISQRLDELKIPSLVLWGENDTWLPPSMAKQLAGRLGRSPIRYLARAGHFAPEDNAEDFAVSVEKFLRDVEYLDR